MIGKQPKISIIIPVYNAEKYLELCITSCMQQTLYDIEIICVNDGSTDQSQQIIDKYAALDYRILSVKKENGGLSSARNAGIDASCGTIIMFLDSDDYLEHNACERVWSEHSDCAPDIIGFGTSIFPLMPHANDWMYQKLSNVPTKRYWKFEPSVLFVEPGAHPFVWRNAFSRAFLVKNELRFDEQIAFGEDTVFQLEAYPHGSRFAFLSDHLYHYRWYRKGSMMERVVSDSPMKLNHHIEIIDHIAAYWDQNGWLEKYGGWFFDWALDFVIPDLNSLPIKDADEYYKKLHDVLERYQPQRFVYQRLTPSRENCWKHIQSFDLK